MRCKSFKYKLLKVGISAAALSVLLLMVVNVLAVRSLSSQTRSSEFSKVIAAQQLRLPVRLEGIESQIDLSMRDGGRDLGLTFYLKPAKGVMVLENLEEGEGTIPSVLKLRFIEAHSHSTATGMDDTRSKDFFFIGTDTKPRGTGIPS